MSDVFISYAREDIDFVKSVFDALDQQNRHAWVDWKNIPVTADWLEEVYRGIEGADNFIFIISPESIVSEVCGKELDHAIQQNKRLIPVVRREVPGGPIPAAIRRINWIYFRSTDNFQTAFETLTAAVDLDLAWIKEQTRLLVRAIEWEQNQRSANLLLHGNEINRAEKWLEASANNEQKPTALQIEYILASRTEATRRQRRTIVITIVTAIVLGIAAVVAIYQSFAATAKEQQRATAQAQAEEQAAIAQSEEQQRATAQVYAEIQSTVATDKEQARATAQALAERRADLALSRQLAMGSRLAVDEQYDLALLMAVEALHIDNTAEARSALFQSLEHIPEVSRFIHLNFEDASPYYGSDHILSISPNGHYLAYHGNSPTILLVDLQSDPFQVIELHGHAANIMAIQFESASGKLLSLDWNGTLIFWDPSTLQPEREIQIATIANQESSAPVAISPNGQLVASTNNEEVYISSTVNGAVLNSFAAVHSGMPPARFLFSPDSRTLASGAFYNAMLVDVNSGEILPDSTITVDRPVSSLAFDPEGKFFAAGNDSGYVAINNLESGEIKDNPPEGYVNIFTNQLIPPSVSGHLDTVTGLAFSSDGQLVSGSFDQNIIIWNALDHWPNEGPIQVHTAPISSLIFSPEEQQIVSVDENSTLVFWHINQRFRLFESWEDTSSLNPVYPEEMPDVECQALTGDVESICFLNPKGDQAISYRLEESFGAYANDRLSNSRIRIWDHPDHQLIGEYFLSNFEPDFVSFSEDGEKAILFGASSGWIFPVLDLSLDSWIDQACRIAGRNFTQDEWNRFLGEIPYRETCFLSEE